MAIQVACRCGKRFTAREDLAGRRVKCPACGGALDIPAAELDLLEELDDLASFESAMPEASPAATLPSTLPAKKSPPKSEGLSRGLLIGLGGGGAGLVLLILVLVFAGGGDSDSDLAQAPSVLPAPAGGPDLVGGPAPSPMDSPAPQPLAPAPAAAGTATPAPAPIDPVATPTGVRPNPQANNSLFQPTTSGSAPDNASPAAAATSSSDSGDSSEPETSSDDASNSASQRLASGTLDWMRDDSTHKSGMYRVDDALPVGQYSWMSQMLPYLGHQKVYDGFDFRRPWLDKQNLQVAAILIPEFQNPLDDRKRWEGYPFGGLPLTHFVGMSGVEDDRHTVAAALPRSHPAAGVFGYDEVATPDQITDGTSNTIMLIGSGEITAPWVQGGGATVRGARQPYFDPLTGFGSQGGSQRGAVTLFADGSIRHLPADIDPGVFRALCTIHGAEDVDLSVLESAR